MKLRALALLLFPLPLLAQSKAAPSVSGAGFNWVLEGGFAFGGDEVVRVVFTDGSDQTLTAGQGGHVAFGGQYRLPSVPRLAIAATAGIKFVTNASENASIGITRIPVEVMGRWSLENDWYLGAGLVQHASVNVNGDGFFPDETLDASMGTKLELGWRWVSVSYTAMDYTAGTGEVFDAGAIAFNARWVIGRR